jgi:MFS family permease
MSSQASPTIPSRPLFKDKSFWSLLWTQFLGAFNDNVFKQIVLLLAIQTAVTAAGQSSGRDWQGWATTVFSLPFVVLSGLAGFLSDKYPKRRVIVLSKVAEIVVMFLGLLAFLNYNYWGAIGTWTVLFLMGAQSTFFGPGKYGILPEVFDHRDLPKANGLILMTTFLAIIFGTVVAGFLFDKIIKKPATSLTVVEGGESPTVVATAVQADGLWPASVICIIIAVVGTMTSLGIRPTKSAQPNSKLGIDDWGLAAPVRSMLWNDPPLLKALLVSCVFWMVSGLVLPTVNRLGRDQLLVSAFMTSLLPSATALGIMGGSILSGIFLKKLSPTGQVSLGLGGMVATMVFLGGWTAKGGHWLGYGGCFGLLVVLGLFAAIYAVPLQVFLQGRPPSELKGRMIGTMNQANFVGVLVSGPLYQAMEAFASAMGWPISSLFWMLAICFLPLAILYRLGR